MLISTGVHVCAEFACFAQIDALQIVQLEIRRHFVQRDSTRHFSVAMDAKILTLQNVGFSAVDKARKLLSKAIDVPPQALRCEYPMHVFICVCDVFALACLI